MQSRVSPIPAWGFASGGLLDTTYIGDDLNDQIQWQPHQRPATPTGPIGGDAGTKHILVDGRHDATCGIWSAKACEVEERRSRLTEYGEAQWQFNWQLSEQKVPDEKQLHLDQSAPAQCNRSIQVVLVTWLVAQY